MIDVVLANSVDYDEMLHSAAFHLGLHYLSNRIQTTKGQKEYSKKKKKKTTHIPKVQIKIAGSDRNNEI